MNEEPEKSAFDIDSSDGEEEEQALPQPAQPRRLSDVAEPDLTDEQKSELLIKQLQE